MNRTATLIIAAFATLTGCAEERDAPAGRGDSGFSGIERSQPVGAPTILEQVKGKEDGGGAPVPPTGTAPGAQQAEEVDVQIADVPAGTYWLEVAEVMELEGNAQMEVGQKIMSIVTEVDGVPMLQGMAPMVARGDELSAVQIDTVRAEPEEGDCMALTALVGHGTRISETAFEMVVDFEDRVDGEDCEKIGYGTPKSERVAFRGVFTWADADQPEG
jgi:hypothetical protein